VGLPLAIAAATAGHSVVGVDTDQRLVENIMAGQSFTPDVSERQIRLLQEEGQYSISNSFEPVSNSEIVILCVPTPLDVKRNPDYSPLKKAIDSILIFLKSGTLVIIESTIAPGATRGMIKEMLDTAGVYYELAYSPERIDPANTEWNVVNTPKLVSGLTIAAAERATDFYKTFVENVQVASSLEVVETAKLLENSFRLINISFINEIAQFCAAMQIDVREVVDAAATKPYGFMPFYPSAGVGGHCIPVDPSYLSAKADELGAPIRFIDLANDVNRSLPSYFAGIAAGILGGLQNRTILVVGIAYKAEVSDVRETPAAGLITELRSKGADVAWHDDLVKEWNGEKSVPLSPNYDLVVLVNPHNETDLSVLASAKVLNTRGGY
jgi:UDP-N-acetyl-D-glucosamine dehydrogenase